ncbi:MAG TPA: YihY/virulence factor BrkB family protein [Acidimicrobiales bacterium]|nr:YihY/virulence factor BrkB family protein [Acidimicrobiales bacterium]
MLRQADEQVPPQVGGGGGPDSPAERGAAGWKASLKRAAAEFKADRGTLAAAGMAFYWFLAVFPAVLAAVGLVGLVGLSREGTDAVVRALRSALPGDAAGVLVGAVQRAGTQSKASSVSAAVIGVAAALWGATAGMVALQRGLDVAYDVATERRFVKARLVALELIAAAAVCGGAATALIVFGRPLGNVLHDHLPLGALFVLVWTIARWVVALGFLSLMFALFYYLGPNRDSPRFVWISPGGVVAALLWLAASLAFSFYVSSFSSYARTYGSLTGVVVLLLWLYLSAIAVVAGGELNAELERQAAKEAAGPPPEQRRRPEPLAERVERRRARLEEPVRAAGDEEARRAAEPVQAMGDDEARRLADAWQASGRRS